MFVAPKSKSKRSFNNWFKIAFKSTSINFSFHKSVKFDIAFSFHQKNKIKSKFKALLTHQSSKVNHVYLGFFSFLKMLSSIRLKTTK